jgi:hypothetical protein
VPKLQMNVVALEATSCQTADARTDLPAAHKARAAAAAQVGCQSHRISDRDTLCC